MSEKPRRPTLHLKFAPSAPAPNFAPPARASAAPVPSLAEKTRSWKCKPCGTKFQVPAGLADDDHVRCPSCNARLGLAKDFQGDPPNLPRLRARVLVD